MKIKILYLLILFSVVPVAQADKDTAMTDNPYLLAEHFPKDYFLIHSNLPHFMHILRANQNSETIALTDKQKQALDPVQGNVAAVVMPVSTEIRKLELEIMRAVVDEKKGAAELQKKIDQVAIKRSQLTAAQINCMNEVQKLLSKKQYAALLKLARFH